MPGIIGQIPSRLHYKTNLSSLSAQHNFRYAGKGFQQHKMLSWTREIFECGFKFSFQGEDFAVAFLPSTVREFQRD